MRPLQGIADGDEVVLGNRRGQVAPSRAAVRGCATWRLDRGVDLAERLLPDGRGINTLTGADPIAPFGGAAFHDSHVTIRRCAATRQGDEAAFAPRTQARHELQKADFPAANSTQGRS